ncbi:hypothetical protein [Streptomyces sp. NPDC046821]|uniref:hypothetical protein n=1 Tax=Streptomyces sp. NPDC046821 TaxID=3154702 RepID=UPI0033DE0EFC
MADEQNKWLDRDAAERLLRGEPLEAADAATLARAERLARTLDALAVTRDDGGELPGEAAAMAAFREARGAAAKHAAAPLRGVAPAADARRGDSRAQHVGAHAGTAPLTLASVSPLRGSAGRENDANANTATALGTDFDVRAGSDVGSVRIGRPAARPVRWGRPVRLGMAAALAGCMIGGVAVAAGTGVLPSPFGKRDEPAPAASVSAAATPEQPEPSASPDTSKADGGRLDGELAGEGSQEPGSGTPTKEDAAGVPDSRATLPGTGVRTPGVPGTDASGQGLGGACRAYRDGTLSAAQTQRLKDTAKRIAARKQDRDLDRFCANVLEGNGAGNGNANGGNEGGDGNGNKDDGNGGGQGGQGGDGDNANGGQNTGAGFAAIPTATWSAATPGAPERTLPTTQSPSASPSPSPSALASESASASPSATTSASYSAGPTAP